MKNKNKYQSSNLFLNYFKPSIYVKNVSKINLESLKKHGIKVIICDLDNTLVPFYRRIPNQENLDFINRIKKIGLKIVLVSNNIKKRVEYFAIKAGIDYYIANAKKPFLKSFLQIKKELNVEKNEIIMIGDQLITDIFYANRAHIESILVVPVAGIDDSNKLIKLLDNLLYKRLEQKNILHKGFYDEGEYGKDYDIL